VPWSRAVQSWRRGASYARTGAASRGGGVVVGRPVVVAGRFEGTVDRGPYVAQWCSWRRFVPAHSNSVGGVITVPSVALQWHRWPHRVDRDGDDRSRRPNITAWPCVITEKVFEGAAGHPSRARRVSRTGVGGAVSRG
jgi:hypothetical protein